MCWDPLLEGGGHPTPRGAWRPPSVERAGLVQGSVGDGNPGSGSRVCAGSAGAGRGVAGENVVGLLPWKQRTSLSLPVNRLLPEAGGIEGPVLSLSFEFRAKEKSNMKNLALRLEVKYSTIIYCSA